MPNMVSSNSYQNEHFGKLVYDPKKKFLPLLDDKK